MTAPRITEWDQEAIDFILRNEGARWVRRGDDGSWEETSRSWKPNGGTHLKTYDDKEGHETSGYGHLVTKSDREADGGVPEVMDPSAAYDQLVRDYIIHKEEAQKTPGWDSATPNQQKALVDLAFNMGGRWWINKGFVDFTKAVSSDAPDWNAAADSLWDSNWRNQVGERSDRVLDLIRPQQEFASDSVVNHIGGYYHGGQHTVGQDDFPSSGRSGLPASEPHARGAFDRRPGGGGQPVASAAPSLPATSWKEDPVTPTISAGQTEPTLGEKAALVAREGPMQVVGGTVEGFLHNSADAYRSFSGWLDDVFGIEGGGFVVDSDQDISDGVWRPTIRFAGSEEFYGEDGPPTLMEALVPRVPEPETAVGDVVRDMSQFISGFWGLGKVGPLSSLKSFLDPKKLTVRGKGINVGSAVEAGARGFAVDTIMFDPDDPLVSDALNELIKNNPELQNPVMDYLRSDPNDTEAEARLKRGVEGIIIGETIGLGLNPIAKRVVPKVTEGFIKALKAIKTKVYTNIELKKMGLEPRKSAEASDEARHQDLDELEAQRQQEEEILERGDPEEIALLEAGKRDPRAERRGHRKHAIQAIMDKYGYDEVTAVQYYEDSLSKRVLPRLAEADAKKFEGDESKEISALAKQLRKVIREIRSGSAPELQNLPRNPILSEMKRQGGVKLVRQNEAGEWVPTELASELKNMGITPKSMPGLFRDPRKLRTKTKTLLSGRFRPEPKGSLDQFDFSDNPYLRTNPEDTINEIGYERVYDGIQREVDGDPLRSQYDEENILQRSLDRDQLRAEMDAAGIDPMAMTDEQIAGELHRKWTAVDDLGRSASDETGIPRYEPEEAVDEAGSVWADADGNPVMRDSDLFVTVYFRASQDEADTILNSHSGGYDAWSEERINRSSIELSTKPDPGAEAAGDVNVAMKIDPESARVISNGPDGEVRVVMDPRGALQGRIHPAGWRVLDVDPDDPPIPSSKRPYGDRTDGPNRWEPEPDPRLQDQHFRNNNERPLREDEDPYRGTGETVRPRTEQRVNQSTSVERHAWENTAAEEAELLGIPEGLLRALERVSRPGRKSYRDSATKEEFNTKASLEELRSGGLIDEAGNLTDAGREAGIRETPNPAYGGDLARGLPRATPSEVRKLQTSGFLDADGYLTSKGAETLKGRVERFEMARGAARRGEPVSREMAREWPSQIGAAYRRNKQMRAGGRPKKPGQDESDNLTVDEAMSVEEEILSQRRVWDAKRGRELIDELASWSDDLTESGISREVNDRINNAVLDLFQAGKVTRNKHLRLFEQVAELIASRRVAPEEFDAILDHHKLDWTDMAAAWATDKSEAARLLGQLGLLEKAIRRGAGVSQKRRLRLKERLKDPDLAEADRKNIERILNSGDLDEGEILDLMSLPHSHDYDMVLAIGTWRRLENIRRGELVSQISTAMRNLMTQQGNVGVGMMTEAFEHAIRLTFRATGNRAVADNIHPTRAFETMLNLFREGGARLKSWDSEGTEEVDKILSMFVKERELLTSQFNADVAHLGLGGDALSRVERFVVALNTFNRFQEHVFRRASFKAELGRLIAQNPVRLSTLSKRERANLKAIVNNPDEMAKMSAKEQQAALKQLRDNGSVYRSIDEMAAEDLLGGIPQGIIRRAVDHSLDVTWAKRFDPNKPTKRKPGDLKDRHPYFDSFTGSLVQAVNKTPFLSWFAPFPRFVANSIQWQIDHSAYGLLEAVVSPRGQALMLEGDYSEVAKGLSGTTLFFSAMELVNSEYATDVWHQFRIPDFVADTVGFKKGTTFDMRPYAPFSGYLWGAYLMKKAFVPMMEGRPTELNSLTVSDLAQGFAASNFRAGAGLYVFDQMATDLASYDPSAEGIGGGAGRTAGDILGNVASSYFVFLNPLWDAYKHFSAWNGDRSGSEVHDPEGQLDSRGMPFGSGSGDPIIENAQAFAAQFAAQVGTRIPPVAEWADYPEAIVPGQEDSPISYAPIWKATLGFTFKEPLGLFQNETKRLDLSKSDLIPSSGITAWDNAVTENFNKYVPEIEEWMERPSSAYMDDTPFRAKMSRPEQVQNLRDRISYFRNRAMDDAKVENPDLFRLFWQSRRDRRGRKFDDLFEQNQEPR